MNFRHQKSLLIIAATVAFCLLSLSGIAAPAGLGSATADTGEEAPVQASICPASSPGQCVYKKEIPAYKFVEEKTLMMLLGALSTSPYNLAELASQTDPEQGFGGACELKAICITASYTITHNNVGTENDSTEEIDESRWYISHPITIAVHETTGAMGIPIYLDFRGPKGQKTTITTINGNFTSGVEAGAPYPCGVTFNVSHLFAAGFRVENMPGDGMCDVAGAVALDFEDIAANGNGGNGITINGDDVTLTNAEASYNGGNGIVINGRDVIVRNIRAINNIAAGIRISTTAEDVSISGGVVAGNIAGNIVDESGKAEIADVTEECPEGYTIAEDKTCKLNNCAENEFDYLGTCVTECPAGYMPDDSKICRQTPLQANMADGFDFGEGGCSITAKSKTPNHALWFLFTIPLLCLFFSRKRCDEKHA